jgi:two-component system, NarL family, invasion response regulator UvrY
MNAGIRVLLADDHELVREGLRRILLASDGIAEVGEAVDAAGTIAAVEREAWDLVILDLNLPGRNGLEVLKDIKHRRPKLPVLILSIHREDQFAIRAVRAGADGYVSKAAATRELIRAIQTVRAGRRYVSQETASQLIEAIRHPDSRPPHASLSDREDEIMRLLGDGLTVGEIAARLNLSVKTVSTHRANLLRKLGLENNAQLMRYVHEHGLSA